MRNAIVRQYLRILLIGGGIVTVGGFAYATLTGHLPANFWIFRCDASLYSTDRFIAYCGDPAYGDYEHAALYFATDPAIANSLHSASVLFVGNSRAQKVFSAESLEHYFESFDIRYYNLATSGEMDIFPRLVIQHLDLEPRIVVVGADYFFYNSLSKIGKSVTSGNPRAALENQLKHIVQTWHQKWCHAPERSAIGSVICSSDPRFTMYKSRRNGRIYSEQWPAPEPNPVPATADAPYPVDRMDSLIENARSFEQFLRLRGVCLVITAIPYPGINAAAVHDIAQAINAPFVEVSDDGLYTYDGSHMDLPSAELWAERFLLGFGAARQACESQTP